MPMELRKRKAPAVPVPAPPAPKRKATAPKKDKKTTDAEPKPAKKVKVADKAEVTTEPPVAADAEAPIAKPAAKPKAVKETKTVAKPAEPAKKEEKPKEKKEKAAPAPKEKKEVAAKEKKEVAPKEKKEAAPKEKKEAAPKAKEDKAKEDKPEVEKKEKKAASKSATATPAPSTAVELKPGDALPTGLPEISNHAGEKITITGLLDASKTGIVIFAYPAAATPGCTKQVNFFNASKDAFEAQGYSIFGLSGDKPEKNLKFKEKEKLTYPLLSDVTYELHQKIGIAKPGGKGTLRSSVVISKDGKIVAIKKAGPEETLKAARAACELPAEDSKTKAVEKAVEKKVEAEEAPDAAT